MQQALEAGQLDEVAEMMGIAPEDVLSDEMLATNTEDEPEELLVQAGKMDSNMTGFDGFYNDFDLFNNEDSV